MTTSTLASPERPVSAPRIAARWVGLGSAIALMAAGVFIPLATGWNVEVRRFPPFLAEWEPRVGVGTIPALAVGALATAYAARVAETVRWRSLLVACYCAGLAWMFALVLVDGRDGIADVLNYPSEYLRTARATSDIPGMLQEYVSRIPLYSRDNWPTHLAGHPPGAVLFFIALVRLGLGSGLAAGIVVTLVAASTAPAVLCTLRTLGAEAAARRAAPFLVFAPAAVWMCVSADAVFGAFAAWGMAALALATTRRSLTWSVLAGLTLGYVVMMSYGLPLLGLLAVAILIIGGSWRPLLP
ncbi:MAG: hypothetical protein ACRCYU_07615, partial [Nocardioides sp.]